MLPSEEPPAEAPLHPETRPSSTSWAQHLASLKELLLLSIPNTITCLLSMGLPVASTFFVGHIGSEHLGAATLGNMLANATGFAIIMGLSMALDTLCPQAYGAGQYRLVGLHCQRAMTMLTLACIPIAALWMNTQFILELVGVPSSTAALSALWVRYIAIGLWPWMLSECFRRYLQAQRLVWPITVTSGIILCLHILDTYLLVIKFNWGYVGAALSTAISYWLFFIICVTLTYGRRLWVRRRARREQSYELVSVTASAPSAEQRDNSVALSHVPSSGSLEDLSSPHEAAAPASSPSPTPTLPPALPAATEGEGDPEDSWPAPSRDIFRGWWDYMRLGVPAATSLFIEWGSYEVNVALAARLGVVPLATHSVLSATAGIWYMTPLGVAVATSTLIGNMLGANKPEQAKIYAKVGYAIEGVYGLCNGALGMAYRCGWGGLFSSDDAVVQMVAMMMPVLWLYGFWDALKCVGMAVLRGCGRPTITVWGGVLSCVVVGYPTALLLVFVLDFGMRGLWTAMSLAWVVASSFYLVIILRTDWEHEARQAALRNENALEGLELSGQGARSASPAPSSADVSTGGASPDHTAEQPE